MGIYPYPELPINYELNFLAPIHQKEANFITQFEQDWLELEAQVAVGISGS